MKTILTIAIIFACSLAGYTQTLPHAGIPNAPATWREAMGKYDFSSAVRLLDLQLDSLTPKYGFQADSTITGTDMTETAVIAAERATIKELLLHKATCQKNLYKFSDAISTLEEALQYGTDAATMASIAECHRLGGNDIAAYMFYDIATGMAPDNLFIRIQKMMQLYKMEDYGPCIAEGRHILETETIPSILVTVGNCFNRKNMGDSALVYYGRAYELNPLDYRTLEKISGIYLGRGMYDTVLVLTENYLRHDSTNVVINPIKGLAQYNLKDYVNSYETFQKSLEYGCDELSGYWYLGLNKLMEEDYYTARKWFKKAAMIDSTDVNLVYYQGVCYAKYPGNYAAEAHTYFRKAEEMLRPDSTMMYKLNSSWAESYMKIEDYANATKHFKKAETYGTLLPMQLVRLGFSYRLQKDYPNALKYYEKYFEEGKKGSSTWKFAEEEVAFIKEEQFMEGDGNL